MDIRMAPTAMNGSRFPVDLMERSLTTPDAGCITAAQARPINEISPRVPFLSRSFPKTVTTPASRTSNTLIGRMPDPMPVAIAERPNEYKLRLNRLAGPRR